MTERQVQNLVRRVCFDKMRSEPEIFFVDHHVSHTHDDGITLMSPEFWRKYKVGSATQYRLLVLHELAHWFDRGEGHTARFYRDLFSLCRIYGVRLSVAYDDEVAYKPRAARAGLNRLFA